MINVTLRVTRLPSKLLGYTQCRLESNVGIRQKKLLKNHRITPSPISAREERGRNISVAVDYYISSTVRDSKGIDCYGIAFKRHCALLYHIGCGTIRIVR